MLRVMGSRHVAIVAYNSSDRQREEDGDERRQAEGCKEGVEREYGIDNRTAAATAFTTAFSSFFSFLSSVLSFLSFTGADP